MAAKGVVKLSPADKLELYYWMRLTRTLEERLVNLHRQNKLVGGLFRSLGQEADAVGSAFAVEERDVLSSLTRNLGSLLVKGATPVEVIRQHMATVDSPTRGRDLGLHFADIAQLLSVLNRLVDAGNTVIVIEHNLDVIKTADWVIDLGPDGGSRGGRIVAQGTPEDVAKVKESYTGQYLKKALK